MQRVVILLLIVVMAVFSGCGTSSRDGPGAGQGSASVALEFSLAAYAVSPLATASAPAASGETPGELFQGVLLVTNAMSPLDYQTFDWSAYVDGSTFSGVSNKTIILAPGSYNFYLLLIKGSQTYAGAAYLQSVVDGQNTIALTIRPVIGDTLASVQVVQELADFRFQYDPAELGGFALPRLGILVDGGAEQRYALDATSGLSEHLFINLTPGVHTLELRFYSDTTQLGRSLPEQETAQVTPGQDLVMDLVALQGQTTLLLDEAGGDVTFSFSIPAEVVDEAGGLADLQTLFSVVVLGGSLQEALLSPTPVGDHYEASIVLGGFQYGDPVALSVAFADLGGGSPEPLGACVVEDVVLELGAKTVLCGIELRRRAIIGGSLLATLGLNAWSPLYEPVAGAVVHANGAMIGITGSGAFGTAGYLKTFLPAGDYLLEVSDGTQQGSLSVSLLPLTLNNVDIVLDTPVPTP